MSQAGQVSSDMATRVQELAELVDERYSRPRYWTQLISFGGFSILTAIVVILLGQIILIGSQTGELSISDTVTSMIAFLALVISLSKYIESTELVNSDEWITDCIKHNQRKICKENPSLSNDERMILSGIVKLKAKNESARIADVVKWLEAYDIAGWIAFLYEIGDGSSLLKQ